MLVVSRNERIPEVLSELFDRDASLFYAGSSFTVAGAIELLRASPSDVVVSDAPPKRPSEVPSWRELHQLGPRTLMLATYLREADVVLSLLAGASGHILAPAGRGPGLIDAIVRVARGASLYPAELTARLRAMALSEAPSRLESDERMVLRLILDQKPPEEIGLEAGATADEVRRQIVGIAEKLTRPESRVSS